MSIKLMSKAWDLDIPLADKMVLLALADSANEKGECWPSIEEVAKKASLSDRAVQKCLKHLVEGGHVSINRRYKKSNVFFVHPKEFYPERSSPEQRSPEPGSPEQKCISTPNDVHPLKNLTILNEPSKKNRQSERKRSPDRPATRLPEDFELTPERRLVAEAERLPADRTFAKFCDYWQSASGAKARKLDWDATWRNWCRTERDRAPGNGQFHVNNYNERRRHPG